MGQSASVTHIQSECLFGFRRRRRSRRLRHRRVDRVVVRTPPTNVARRADNTVVGDRLAQAGGRPLVRCAIVLAGQGTAVRYTALGALRLRPRRARIARPDVARVDILEAHADGRVELKRVPLRHALLVGQRARASHQDRLIKHLPFWPIRRVSLALVHRLFPQLKLKNSSFTFHFLIFTFPPFGRFSRKLVAYGSEKK